MQSIEMARSLIHERMTEGAEALGSANNQAERNDAMLTLLKAAIGLGNASKEAVDPDIARLLATASAVTRLCGALVAVIEDGDEDTGVTNILRALDVRMYLAAPHPPCSGPNGAALEPLAA